MKWRGSIFFSLIVVVLLFFGASWPAFDQVDSDKESILLQTILAGLSYWHYEPVRIDDDFSRNVYRLYLDRMDPARRFLTQEDLQLLRGYNEHIDDEAKAGSYEFFNLSIKLLDAGREKAQTHYKEILAQPFDFSVQESFDLDYENKPFAKNDAELREYWRKSLKYETLSRIYNRLEKKDSLEKAQQSFEELEADVRESVMKSFDNYFKRLSKERRSDHLTRYLNALTNIFDPHTGYYLPKDKEDFDIRISGTLEGIGAQLTSDGDYTKVAKIIPGGPAWKQKELEAKDLIIKVAQGDEEPVDVIGMRLDDVVKLIRGKKGTEVKLTVKQPDGNITVISIIRDVVILDEQYAKSVILEHPGVDGKIGYIRLPSFYADFNRNGGPTSSRDIARELDKLKKRDVEGIILDLRFNGGGSLSEVVDMSGLFIEKGPVVQVKARREAAKIERDEDPSVQYDGPLIVLVNSFSASASEILAAALQDYGRAIIVGSKSTYGKGTVQRFINLDRAVQNKDVKPLGQVKMTIQKFYRINGGSVQLRGVEPDIVLPDQYSYSLVGERDQDYPMEWSKIDPVSYGQDVITIDHLPEIISRSAERVRKSEVFNKIEENAVRLKDQKEHSVYPLNYEEFSEYVLARKEEARKYKDIMQPIEELQVSNLEEDLASINLDESSKARNEEWLKSVNKDVYIHEALLIMDDFLELN